MSQDPSSNESHTQFEAIKHVGKRSAIEFWSARDLMVVLGYDEWRNFENTVIRRAMAACEQAGAPLRENFVETNKVSPSGKRGPSSVDDYWVSRFAGYLIAMNGDPHKTAVAEAQAYFAIQTRRQELSDKDAALEQRIEARIRLGERTNHCFAVSRFARRQPGQVRDSSSQWLRS